jgi:hypothetical protein
MSFYALKDHMDEKAWKDFEGVEPPATHMDDRTEITAEERMKREEPNLDGPYDQALRASLKQRAQDKQAERGRKFTEEVLATINRDRQNDYGAPEDTFALIATFWSAYLGTEVKAPDVAAMMQLLKIARQRGGKSKKDNFVDLVGYAILEADMRGIAV